MVTVIAGTILDGFDIGVGCLSLVAPESLRPRMMSLLSPWRDANEFWLFLGMIVFAVASDKFKIKGIIVNAFGMYSDSISASLIEKLSIK